MAVKKSKASANPKNKERANTASKTPSAGDLKAVHSRLSQTVYELLAVHRTSINAQEADRPELDIDLKAIERLARSAIRGVQACQARLGDTTADEDFVTEFD